SGGPTVVQGAGRESPRAARWRGPCRGPGAGLFGAGGAGPLKGRPDGGDVGLGPQPAAGRRGGRRARAWWPGPLSDRPPGKDGIREALWTIPLPATNPEMARPTPLLATNPEQANGPAGPPQGARSSSPGQPDLDGHRVTKDWQAPPGPGGRPQRLGVVQGE